MMKRYVFDMITGKEQEYPRGEWVKADIAEEMYDTLNVIRQSVPLTEYTQSKIDKILQKARGEQ